jgi:hypothetical protein
MGPHVSHACAFRLDFSELALDCDIIGALHGSWFHMLHRVLIDIDELVQQTLVASEHLRLLRGPDLFGASRIGWRLASWRTTPIGQPGDASEQHNTVSLNVREQRAQAYAFREQKAERGYECSILGHGSRLALWHRHGGMRAFRRRVTRGRHQSLMS